MLRQVVCRISAPPSSGAGLARLREYMSEVPAESFRPRMNLADVPTLFTVETMCKIVIRALRAGGA